MFRTENAVRSSKNSFTDHVKVLSFVVIIVRNILNDVIYVYKRTEILPTFLKNVENSMFAGLSFDTI